MRRNAALKNHVLIYDGDCAFCTLWVNRLRAWLPAFPELKTSQEIVVDDYALTPADVEKFAWYVTPTHQYAGHLALSALLQAQPRAGLRFLGAVLRTPPISLLGGLVYSFVARYRHRLPGGTPSCATPDTTKS
jgi:predicted DCC family thiol-disulfide oxidoreductase YuxK